jgi:hypothetical protein
VCLCVYIYAHAWNQKGRIIRIQVIEPKSHHFPVCIYACVCACVYVCKADLRIAQLQRRHLFAESVQGSQCVSVCVCVLGGAGEISSVRCAVPILIFPAESRKMFCGFRSRWRMRLSCKYFRPVCMCVCVCVCVFVVQVLQACTEKRSPAFQFGGVGGGETTLNRSRSV